MLSISFITGTLLLSSASHLAFAQVNPFTWSGVRYDCKCSDIDACWPAASVWSALNATVGGNLQKVVPDAAVCYNTFEGTNTYNQAACQDVTRNFNGQDWQYVLFHISSLSED
jgi:hypothetical protein